MGERGPAPKPATLHLLHGNAGKKSLASLLDDVVRPRVEIPDCPAHLDGEARAEWERIAPHLQSLGLISQIDRAALAAYCDAWGEYVWAATRIAALNGADRKEKRVADITGERGRIWDTPSGYKQISVLQQIRNRALEMLTKFLAEFGMSPSARSRVTPSDPQLGLPGLEKPAEGGWGTFKK